MCSSICARDGAPFLPSSRKEPIQRTLLPRQDTLTIEQKAIAPRLKVYSGSLPSDGAKALLFRDPQSFINTGRVHTTATPSAGFGATVTTPQAPYTFAMYLEWEILGSQMH